jgi:glycosyltransferase involved in cell wall biosynthesis
MAAGVKVALLTGGFDKSYALGLTLALAAKGVRVDVVGSDDVDDPVMHTTPHVNFLNLRGSKEETGPISKASRVLVYYARLFRYAAIAEAKIFHILWNDKFEFFDRAVLMLYYRLLGKKIVRTVHNVNAGKRDANDSLLNRITLRVQYRLSHHVFVHTAKMKQELLRDFGVQEKTATVVPFGINNSVPNTALTPAAAKRQLGIKDSEKTILFFGAIRPYKGLEYLVGAFQQLAANQPEYRLIIAGQPLKESKKYLDEIQRTLSRQFSPGRVIEKIQYIPDEETELYFKAADVVALPYTHVFQSGVLFLAHSFGLPVVASDVGSLKEDIIEGWNGFLCAPCDSADLSRALRSYFESDLFQNLDSRRADIREHANARHSWGTVSEMTRNVYAELAGRTS